MLRDARTPRWGELFGPLPILTIAIWIANDVWLKALFHNFLTGKLSDVAVCFVMPLFLSELLGLSLALEPRLRLAVGSVVTATLFTALEVAAPVTELALAGLELVGPHLGMPGGFEMTSDVTDLACVPLVGLAYWYGRARLRARDTPGT